MTRGGHNTIGRPGRRRTRRRAAAFTLIEAALVTVIVGVGVLAIVSAQQAFHQQNDVSARMGAALLLANEIRELTLNMPRRDPITADAYWGPEPNEPTVVQYDDLDDFDGPDGTGATFSPPIDAQRNNVPDMAGWSQKVTVVNVLPNYVTGVAAPDNSTDVVRLVAQVFYQGPNDDQPREITRLMWYRAGGL